MNLKCGIILCHPPLLYISQNYLNILSKSKALIRRLTRQEKNQTIISFFTYKSFPIVFTCYYTNSQEQKGLGLHISSIAAGLRRRQIAKTSLLQSLRIIEYFLAPALCLSVWTFSQWTFSAKMKFSLENFCCLTDEKILKQEGITIEKSLFVSCLVFSVLQK